MKHILTKTLIVLLVTILPVIAIICAELIGEFLFKRSFGWEGSHTEIFVFILLACVSYLSFKYFGDRIGNVTVWISLSFFILVFIVFFFYQNTVKFTIKLSPFYLTLFLGLLAGYMINREGENKIRITLILGVLPLIFSLGFTDLWTHKIEYGNWTGEVSSTEVIPFSFLDKTGNTVDQDVLHGKVVLFDFWFINCGPCWVKFPKLQEIYEKYSSHPDVNIYAVNRPMKRDEPDALFRTIEEKEYSFPVLRGSQEVLDALGVYKYPTVMLIDRKGLIVFMGELEQAEKKLESLLKEN